MERKQRETHLGARAEGDGLLERELAHAVDAVEAAVARRLEAAVGDKVVVVDAVCRCESAMSMEEWHKGQEREKEKDEEGEGEEETPTWAH